MDLWLEALREVQVMETRGTRPVLGGAGRAGL